MKKFLLPLVLGGVLISCSRDNDNPVAETPILPTKIAWGDNYVDAEFNFSYNGDKLKESNLEIHYGNNRVTNEKITYHYTGDKITSLEYDNDGYFSYYGKGIITFEYNTNGTLKSAKTKGVTYSYDNNHQRISKPFESTRNYVYNADGSISINNNKYIIANGNLMEYRDNDRKETFKHTFDDKNNPFKNVKGIQEIATELYTTFVSAGFEHSFENYKTFNNNMTSSIQYYDNSGVSDRKTYTYEYNSKGYPVKATENIVNSQATINFVKTFTYNK